MTDKGSPIVRSYANNFSKILRLWIYWHECMCV